MKVTEGKFKDRQLQREGQLQKVTAKQREYAEAPACRKIAENTDIITDLQRTGLLEKILHRDNLNKAYKKVKSNKAIYWKQWKRVRTRIRKLRNLNLPERIVFEIANCRKGIWRSAEVLNRALTNKEIANLGYISLTGYYLQVCEN